MSISKAMARVAMGGDEGRGQMHGDATSPYHRLRFTLVPQTLATWGIWGHAGFF